MKIYDTYHREEKELDTSGEVGIYLCGVTVYDDSHIGHARTIIVFDVLRRYLKQKGITVKLVQNFTDVDDKIINRAKRENVRASAISSRYIENYHNDFDALNVERPDIEPKATEHIDDMLDFIKKLENKNMAYPTKNGVYFRVQKFGGYGKLSGNIAEEHLDAVRRIELDKEKEDPLDFALWKFSKEDPSWESTWGRGRPGWHIECSTMCLKHIGKTLAIHGGGNDLIFPHHENEIAQSETHTGKPLAKIWMHVGMVIINGEKMSKSLGNVKSLKYLLSKWNPNTIRLFCIAGNYSKPIDYSEGFLEDFDVMWEKILLSYHKLIQNVEKGPVVEGIEEQISGLKNRFIRNLDNNLNTHLALVSFRQIFSSVFNLGDKLNEETSKIILPVFEYMIDVLGLKIEKVSDEEKTQIQSLIKQREEFRQQKKYEEADGIRDKLAAKGIELKDEIHQTIWMKKE